MDTSWQRIRQFKIIFFDDTIKNIEQVAKNIDIAIFNANLI